MIFLLIGYMTLLFHSQASGVLGELMISLGYLRLTERLTTVIIRARNLPQVQNEEDPGELYCV